MKRPSLSGFVPLLAILLLTAPFLWWTLDVDYIAGTVGLSFSPEHAGKFFAGIGPALALGLLLLGGSLLKKRLGLKFPSLPAPVRHRLNGRVRAFKDKPWALPSLILVLWLPALFLGPKGLSQGTFVALYVILATGLNLTVGMAGILVLGYSAFLGIGAYTFAILQQWIPLPWYAALPLGFAVSATLGWLVALPSLRLRGDYFALVSLGFAEALREVLRNGGEITGGDKGISISIAHRIVGIGPFSSQQVAYMAAIAFALLSVAAIERLYRSRLGRAWVAIREDEIAAGAMGIPVVRMKLLAFALSAGLAGMAGVLFSGFTVFVDPSVCTFEESVLVLAMVILGGLGSIPGAVVGALLLYLVPTWLRDWFPALQDYRLLIFGMILVATMLVNPQGLFGSRRHRLELEGEKA